MLELVHDESDDGEMLLSQQSTQLTGYQEVEENQIEHPCLENNPPEGWEKVTRGERVRLPEWIAGGSLYFRSIAQRYPERANRVKSAYCRACCSCIKATSFRMRSHTLSECKKTDPLLKANFLNDLESNKRKSDPKDLANFYLVLGLVEKNIPFNSFCENVYIKKHYEQVALIIREGESYRIPSRSTMSTSLLSDAYLHCRESITSMLKPHVELTLQLDGFTDGTGDSLYAIIASSSDSDFLLQIVDVSEKKHFTDVILKLVEDTLKEFTLTWGNFNAIVTDNVASMASLKDQISLKTKGGVQALPCVLHILNLVTKDLCSLPYFASCISNCNAVISFTRKSHIWNYRCSDLAIQKKTRYRLCLFCATRWYSTAKMLLSFISYFSYFPELLASIPKSNHPGEDVKQLMMCKATFEAAKLLACLIVPVANTIALLERRTSTLPEVLESFLALDHGYLENFRLGLLTFPETDLASIRNFLRDRAMYFNSPIFFISFFLYPKYRDVALTGKLFQHKDQGEIILTIMELVRKIAYHIVPTKQAAEFLCSELFDYMGANLIDFFGEAIYTSSFLSLWQMEISKKRFKYLSNVCILLSGIRIHSAATEGQFSQVGLIKTKSRNKLIASRGLNEICVCKSYITNEKIKKQPTKVSQINLEAVLPPSQSSEEYQVEEDNMSDDDKEFFQHVALNSLDDELHELSEFDEEEEILEEDQEKETTNNVMEANLFDLSDPETTEKLNFSSSLPMKRKSQETQEEPKKRKKKSEIIDSDVIGMDYWMNTADFKVIFSKGKAKLGQSNDEDKETTADDWKVEDLSILHQDHLK